MAKVLVCVAWPYANGPIHLGHVAGSLLPPDIFTRHHRMKGDRVLMVSGSDQHGTPVTVRAEKEGVTPDVIADRYHSINKKAIEDLGIEFSLFSKTHNLNHVEVVHDVFLTLMRNGYLYQDRTLNYYCPRDQKFLPDRYVEGRCHRCGNERARGDQCEKCGATFEPGELNEPRCTTCGTEPLLRETEHYFLKLSAFQERLLEYVKDKDYWRQNVQLFTKNWLEAGLKDRAITRDMSWGIPVPLPNTEGKVIYVWFEAVIGYLACSKEWAKLGGNPEEWKEYWMDPETKSYYFLGKDNIPFHTIIWPSILMGYGGLNLPYDVPANEFLTFKGEAFSKSRGVGIDVPSLLGQFDPDVIRYYISVNMPENRDSDFSLDDFEAKINNELVATLGNYYHRVLSFTHRNYEVVPELEGIEEDRKQVLDMIQKTSEDVDFHLDHCEFKRALKSIIDLAQYGNQFFDRIAPWSLIKADREKCGAELALNLEIVKALAVLSHPFLPFSSKRIWAYLGMPEAIMAHGYEWIDIMIDRGQKLVEPQPVFNRVLIASPEDPFKDFEQLNLKVGLVLDSKQHPNADKLLVLDVDIGKRITLVAGLKAHYPGDALKGKSVVVITNLQHARLRGVESMGMILAAEKDGSVKILTPAGDTKPGDPIGSGRAQSEKEISLTDFQRLTMRVGEIKGKEVDVGRRVALTIPNNCNPSSKVTVFLPSPDASAALVLCTEAGVPITVEGGEIGNGAEVR
jgi:methionyl-tRNA synthetase